MSGTVKRQNVLTLKKLLEFAEQKGCAIGSFSPRYTAMIHPILSAAEKMQSPAIVQISHNEMARYGISPFQFANEFYNVLREESITVPVALHLDHTRELPVIRETIEAGFTSVMIDASDKELEENIAITREVVQYAHAKGVSVEAELGKIGTTDFVETDTDEEYYTDPAEAHRFVQETGTDALAVSVGTAHGVYTVKQPKIDYERLTAIRALTPVHLVLHGGSGVPADMILKSVQLAGGGISKVNIATDLELSMLAALGRKERMTNAQCCALGEAELKKAREAVEATVMDKIVNFLGSQGRAKGFDFA